MKVKIDKATIIKALETEPLCHGHWIRSIKGGGTRGDRTPINDPSCRVCAVGSILRQVMKGTTPSERLSLTAWKLCPTAIGSQGMVKLLLEQQNYLDALSCYFESMEHKVSLKKSRPKLVDFVNKHFPETLIIEMDKQWVKKLPVQKLPSLLPPLPKMTLEEYIGVPFIDAHLLAEQRWQQRAKEKQKTH